ncbi:MAG: multidrug efflux MFS transporter [Chloroflexi bacterium]|nr:multidrug efflux MFS transporter [Chloroflexota bacterium]
MRAAFALIRQPWFRIVAILWVAQVVSELAFSFALPFIPLYLSDLGVTDPVAVGLWAGAMAGAFAFVQAAMAPIWGAVADRFGRRLMILRALFGACVVIGAMGLVANVEQLLVLRVLQGTVTGVVAAASVVVSLTVPRAYLATTLGFMHAAMFAGSSLGPLVGGAFADALGYRLAFAATGGLFLVAGLLVLFFVPEPPRAEVPTRGAASEAGERVAVSRGTIVGLVSLAGITRLASMAPAPVLPLYIEAMVPPGAPVATITGAILAATGVASILSALAIGPLMARLGRTATLFGALLVAAIVTPFQAIAPGVLALGALRFILGLALGGLMPAAQAVLTDLTPESRRGVIFGWQATASALGNGAGPVAGGVVAALAGVPALFVFTAPVYAFGIVALRGLRRGRGSNTRA